MTGPSRRLGPAALSWLALLTTQPASGQGSEAASPQRVEVSASREGAEDGRRDQLVGRIVVTREEIGRHGDASLADVLRRVPGVTVLGGPRGAEVRLRGLGSGYTQILINGEPAPRGFTLESLAPGQVERIEVARVATVDQGAQAVAGSINIVLRDVARKPERELKLGVGRQAARPSRMLDLQLGERQGALAWGLGLGLQQRRDRWPLRLRQEASDADGVTQLLRDTQRDAGGEQHGASLAPRLSWQAGKADRLQLDMLLRRTHFDDFTFEQREALVGPPPPYAADDVRTRLHTGLGRLRAGWTHKGEGGTTAELRGGLDRLSRDSRVQLLGRDTQGRTVMDERVEASAQERGSRLNGRLRLPYVQGHAVALGWNAERTRRAESRVQRQSSPTGRPTLDLDEAFDATVLDGAVFVQDEWDPGPGFSLYLGLRHALLNTRTEGAGVATVSQRAAVTSPVLQVLAKPADGEQLRAALSRSYRAPRTRDLVPRRWVAHDNTPTTPDFQGNPALRPELAWGLDLAWEHHLPRRGGTLSVAAGWRRIDDVILERLTQDARGWVSTRANEGRARVQTLELDARLQLRTLWPAAPDAELRVAAARNRSAVQAVPGPDNRLDAQVPASLTLGADWRGDGGGLAAGGSLALQQGQRAQITATQHTHTRGRQVLDLYAAWQWQPGQRLRLAVANALHRSTWATDTEADAATGARFVQRSEEPGAAEVKLVLELKL